jgi:hypothetical protein
MDAPIDADGLDGGHSTAMLRTGPARWCPGRNMFKE